MLTLKKSTDTTFQEKEQIVDLFKEKPLCFATFPNTNNDFFIKLKDGCMAHSFGIN